MVREPEQQDQLQSMAYHGLQCLRDTYRPRVTAGSVSKTVIAVGSRRDVSERR